MKVGEVVQLPLPLPHSRPRSWVENLPTSFLETFSCRDFS